MESRSRNTLIITLKIIITFKQPANNNMEKRTQEEERGDAAAEGFGSTLQDKTTLTSFARGIEELFVCWLLNVPATCECISGTDLHRQFYVLPH